MVDRNSQDCESLPGLACELPCEKKSNHPTRTEESMAPLLQPDECSLVLVDPKTQYVSHVGPSAQLVLRRFSNILAAARIAAVPVHVVLAGDAGGPQELLLPRGQPAIGVHIIHNDGHSWSKSGLAEALATQARTALILCGFWLETTVTFLALPALASGYDVFVLLDITPVRSDEARRPAGHRLLQAGAVPITTHQLIAEWAEQTPDPNLNSSLFGLTRDG
jgi:isochorismatase family protein